MSTPDTLVALAGCMSDGMIVADESGLAYVNASGLKLLGTDRSEDVIGKPLTEVFRPDDLPNILQSVSRHEGDDSGTPIAGRLLRIDGRTVDVSGTSLPILWKGTRACRLLVVRRVSLSEAGKEPIASGLIHRESGQMGSSVGSWEWDLGTGAETWSDDYYRILGYEPGAVRPTSDTFTKALHPDDRDRVADALERSLVSDTPYDVECRIIQPCGALRFIRCRGVVIRNIAGAPVRVLGAIEDRTTDAHAEVPVERVLRESRERLDLVARAGHVGMFEWDHRTGQVYWSPMLRDMLGMSAYVLPSLRRYVRVTHRMDRERILAAIRTARDSAGDRCIRIEHRIVRLDGTVRRVSLHVLTRYAGEGSVQGPICTTGVVVDVTDHVLAEAYRREASKLMTTSTLIGGIAHEFNNSLTAVLGFSQLTLQLIPAESKARHHIQQVIAAGRTSSELIHQLLMINRQNAPSRRAVSLPVFVRESVKLLRSTIPSWIELKEQITASTCPIEADETEMRRMLVILMTGAVHAMRNASGVLDIELKDREFSVEMVTPQCRIPAGRYMHLRVKNSGEGLEPQAGTALDATGVTETSKVEEREIGLSVVRDIVVAHGGTMTVESRVGLGTTVSVYLPVKVVRAPSVSREEASLPRGHEGILFVTAEESHAKRGKEMLQSLGYYTVIRTSANSARAAFNLAPRHFDLLIADQTLSDMTGDQLARECQRLRPDLPVIICIDPEDALSTEQAHSLGITELVTRPLVAHEVAHAIRRVVDRSLPSPSSLPLPPAVGGRRHDSTTSLREVPDAIGPRG